MATALYIIPFEIDPVKKLAVGVVNQCPKYLDIISSAQSSKGIIGRETHVGGGVFVWKVPFYLVRVNHSDSAWPGFGTLASFPDVIMLFPSLDRVKLKAFFQAQGISITGIRGSFTIEDIRAKLFDWLLGDSTFPWNEV